MSNPKPPEGYETWLDYAIGCFDVVAQPSELRTYVESARAELTALRADAERWRAQERGKCETAPGQTSTYTHPREEPQPDMVENIEAEIIDEAERLCPGMVTPGELDALREKAVRCDAQDEYVRTHIENSPEPKMIIPADVMADAEKWRQQEKMGACLGQHEDGRLFICQYCNKEADDGKQATAQ